MITSRSGGIDIFLQPGEWYFGDEYSRIRTTLGSCIAFTFWHPSRRVGAMCHYMLPSRDKPGGKLDGRYGDEVLQLLDAEARRLGTRLHEYDTKLFGGGNMAATAASETGVPARNIAAAWALVEQYQLRVKAEHLGGSGYRQLIFDIASGDVWMRFGSAGQAGGTVGEP